MKFKFCGAVKDVTGSCHMVVSGDHKVLLDCGSFQGGAKADALNAEAFRFDPSEIEAVIISHAHIDHCGRLPLLVKRGFKGSIYATDATAELLSVMLEDSARIAQQDALQENRKRLRAGKKASEPLYTLEDVSKTMALVKGITYDTLIEINDRMKIVFNDAGHILGSAIVELWVEENGKTSKIVYSGDLGMQGRPILNTAKIIKKADYVIMETTYGNRVHEANTESVDKLMSIAVATAKRGGNTIIPSFAVGRTQELIYDFNKVYDGNTPYTKDLKNVPVYIDSPMSVEATEVFKKNAQVYNKDMKKMIISGDHPLDFSELHFIKDSEESKKLNDDKTPKIIISSSGMCDAGRIRHHLKHNLWNPSSSVVFVGYQSEGSLGRKLLDGAETVKLFGDYIAVQSEIYNMEGFSGHADRDGLYDWLNGFKIKPKNIFLVHGETKSKHDFAKYVSENKCWECTCVDDYDEYDIDTMSEDPERASESLLVRQENAEAEFADPGKVADLKSRLEDFESDVSSILFNAEMELSGQVTEETLVEIKNSAAALEKAVYELGAIVSK